jgi:hypothetical protein
VRFEGDARDRDATVGLPKASREFRACYVQTGMTYRGRSDWHDMSEYVVHFTKAPAGGTEYGAITSILWDGRINAGPAVGAARNMGASQGAACLSEIPLHLLKRLVDRRSRYGIGFRQEFLASNGGARVWYLDKDCAVAEHFKRLVDECTAEQFGPDQTIWKLTPFIDFPGDYGFTQYRFEWEREWRVPGGIAFTQDDVAFLFLPEAEHSKAREFFKGHDRDGTGPAYLCPYIDPAWDPDRIRTALGAIDVPTVL